MLWKSILGISDFKLLLLKNKRIKKKICINTEKGLIISIFSLNISVFFIYNYKFDFFLCGKKYIGAPRWLSWS